MDNNEDNDLTPIVKPSEGEGSTSPFYFDEQAADKVIKFFENYLVHIKGEWAGEKMLLDEWQRDLLRELFGWKRVADDLRKYRTLYLEIPRKNGKSTLAAGLALYLLFADGEEGAEVYSAAADREQAAIVFDVAKAMVDHSRSLRQRGESFRRAITYPKTNSSYKVISADAHTKHGFNAHGIVVDEVHAQPNGELIDVLKTSTGARRQPLEIYITTAGHDRTSICWEMHDYALKVIDGTLKDDTFLAVIYAADPNDDWTSPETWKKANPGYGVSIKEDYLIKECAKAKESPRYENTFKRLHLNIWTEQETRWIPIDKWDECSEEYDISRLIKKPCYAGLDLSETIDITALALIFPIEENKIVILPHFWLPEENLLEKSKQDRVPYQDWVKKGFLTLTEGNVIDYAHVKKFILEAAKKYKLHSIAIDRYNSTQIAVELEQEGLEVVLTPQTTIHLNAACRDFEAKILSRKVIHNKNPILRWMIGNVSIYTDSNGNFRPDKKKSKEKIDGVSATINGLTRLIATAEKKGSVYKNRGIATFSVGA